MKKTNDMSRKSFLIKIFFIIGAFFSANFWFLRKKIFPAIFIKGKIVGANKDAGHLLHRKSTLLKAYKSSQSTKKNLQVETLIIGGGISGLSAGWYLNKNNYKNYLIVDLEEKAGGKSFGVNSDENQNGKEVLSYPWAAHYLPLPTKESNYVYELLEEMGIYQSKKKNNKFDEELILYQGEERIYLMNQWQKGLFPRLGASKQDFIQYKKFQKLMNYYRKKIGSDGKKAFTIPLDKSSQDKELLDLDKITMSDFLQQNNFTSERLKWFVEYGTRDDYGSDLKNTSAWAGIHYFAARPKNNKYIVWQQGNSFISDYLIKKNKNKILTSWVVLDIQQKENQYEIILVSSQTNEVTIKSKKLKFKKITANKIIYAAPKYTMPYVFSNLSNQYKEAIRQFNYSPWMVANIFLSENPQGNKTDPIWDNVIYNSDGLGYINSASLSTMAPIENIYTYYKSYSNEQIYENRMKLLLKKHSEAVAEILEDMSLPHPDIDEYIKKIDIYYWGHAMIRPTKNFIWGNDRKLFLNNKKNTGADGKLDFNNLFFANSDISGISIFEEAQYQGIQAAKQILIGK